VQDRRTIVFSPHDDDHALFTSFTCLRDRPTVCVVADSYIQPRRGKRGCSAEDRARETERACAVLDVPVMRFGIHDDECEAQDVINKMLPMLGQVETVYAPAREGGNPIHDIVSMAAELVFTSRCVFYTTYNKQELWTRGTH